MKPRIQNRFLLSTLTLTGLAFATQSASAATYYWDNNGADPGFGTAAGTWSATTDGNTTQGWSNDANGTTLPGNVTPVRTSNANDALQFGTTDAGLGAGTVTANGTVNAGSIVIGSASGAILLSGGTIAMSSAGTITQNSAATAEISSVISSASTSLAKAGTGTLVLSGANTYTGFTRIQNGVLSVSSIANANGTATNLGAPTTGTNGLILLGSAGTTGTLLYTGAAQSTDRSIRVGSFSATPANTDTGGATIQNDGSGALTFTNPTFNSVVAITTGSGANRILTLQGSNTGNNTISGIIKDNTVTSPATGTATVSLIKDGIGTWVLAGNNTYTGNTLVSAGKLVLTNPLALQNSAYDTASVNGGLDLTGITTPTLGGLTGSVNLSSTLITGYGSISNLTLNPGNGTAPSYSGIIANGAPGMTLTKTGAGTQVLSGNNSYSGLTTVSAGVLLLQNASALGSTAAGTTVTGSSRVTLDGITVTGEAITISGTGGNLFGALQGNTGTSVWAGNVTIGANETRIGAASGASLEVSGIIDDGASDLRVLFRPQDATSSVILSGNNTWSGGTTLAGGPVVVTSLNSVNGGTPLLPSSSLGAPATEANGLIIVGSVQAVGHLRYTGSGETTDRTVQIGAGTGGTSFGGAIIENNGTSGALTFGATPNFNTAQTGVIATTARLLTLQGSNTAANTIAGIIQDNAVGVSGTGAVALTKDGDGTWVLGGNNTYTGATTVAAGTLLVNGNQSAANGTVTVAANATLGGNGTLGGATTVNGNLAPGNGIGQLTFTGGLTTGNLSDSSLKFQLGANTSAGTTYDTVVTNSLDIGTTLDFPDFEFTGTPAAGTYTLISSGNTTGTLGGNLTGPIGAFTGTLSKPANDIILTVTGGITTPYDDWATAKGLGGLPGSATDPAKTADPDKDGRNNLAEFAFDGDPLSGANDGKVVGKVATVGGSQVMTLTLPVRGIAPTPIFSDSSGDELSALIDGIYYRIEGDESLSTFDGNITEVTGPDATAIQTGLPGLSATPPDGWSYRTFRATPGTVTTAPKAFLRAKISETP